MYVRMYVGVCARARVCLYVFMFVLLVCVRSNVVLVCDVLRCDVMGWDVMGHIM